MWLDGTEQGMQDGNVVGVSSPAKAPSSPARAQQGRQQGRQPREAGRGSTGRGWRQIAGNFDQGPING